MGFGRIFVNFAKQDRISFLLANRIPRYALSRFMGWFSKIELPPVRTVSIAVWKAFCDVDLSDARDTEFRSLHEAFVRRLKPRARPLDTNPDIVTSPCDAIVGEFGRVEGGLALQIKGMPYPVVDLFSSAGEAQRFEGGYFVTLRLTPGMYHRFHAPHDLIAEQVRYISGDSWSVSPPALSRIDRLLCKNERAPMVVQLEESGHRFVMVPVGAVLVASIRLPWLTGSRSLRKEGNRTIRFKHHFERGEEMGWFEHGSTIVMFSPPEFPPIKGLETGDHVRMGEPLFKFHELEFV